MGGGAQGGDDDIITDINVTPLVDVVLVLLIILMVTATAIVSKTIPMELPEASTAESDTPTPTTVAISIDADGQVYLDREEVTMEELRTQIRRARARDAELRAIIAADGQIQHAKVIQVIDLLRREEVSKFAFNVRPSDLETE